MIGITLGTEALDETLAPLNAKERETLHALLARVVAFHQDTPEEGKDDR